MRTFQRAIICVTLILAQVIGLLGAFPAGAAFADSTSPFVLDFIGPPGSLASDTRFAQSPELGIGWDRFPMYWSSMQPSQGGPIDFSAADATVNADLAHGVAVQAILVGAPSWATS